MRAVTTGTHAAAERLPTRPYGLAAETPLVATEKLATFAAFVNLAETFEELSFCKYSPGRVPGRKPSPNTSIQLYSV